MTALSPSDLSQSSRRQPAECERCSSSSSWTFAQASARASPGGAVQYRAAFAEQLPVGSIRRLGEHDTLARDQFRCRSVARRHGSLHRNDQRITHVMDDFAAGCVLAWVDAQRDAHPRQYADVSLGLVEVCVPFGLQLFVDGTLQRRPVHEYRTSLVLQRPEQQLFHLGRNHARTPGRARRLTEWRIVDRSGHRAQPATSYMERLREPSLG